MQDQVSNRIYDSTIANPSFVGWIQWLTLDDHPSDVHRCRAIYLLVFD
jgi:hypothetical protein